MTQKNPTIFSVLTSRSRYARLLSTKIAAIKLPLVTLGLGFAVSFGFAAGATAQGASSTVSAGQMIVASHCQVAQLLTTSPANANALSVEQ